MKKLGVPDTPLRSADSTSCATRDANVVDPVLKVLRDTGATDPNRQARRPGLAVGRRVDVDPDERRDSRGQEDDRTARLGAEELAQRRTDVARPGGAIFHHGILNANVSVRSQQARGRNPPVASDPKIDVRSRVHTDGQPQAERVGALLAEHKARSAAML